MKVFYFDVETTGLDEKIHDIIQLAFIIEIDNKIVEKHNFTMQPFNYKTIDQCALDVNGLTIEKIKTFQTPQEAFKKLIKVLDKHINKYNKLDKFNPAGYNVKNFDMKFLNEFFKKNGNTYFWAYFKSYALDPLQVFPFIEYAKKIKLNNYKLSTASQYYNIKIEAHDALSDIEATRELIQKIIEYIK